VLKFSQKYRVDAKNNSTYDYVLVYYYRAGEKEVLKSRQSQQTAVNHHQDRFLPLVIF
jgi:hypothetical protein